MIGIDNDIENLAVLFFPVKVKDVMGRDNRGREPTALPSDGKNNLLIGPLLDIRRERCLISAADGYGSAY